MDDPSELVDVGVSTADCTTDEGTPVEDKEIAGADEAADEPGILTVRGAAMVVSELDEVAEEGGGGGVTMATSGV